MRTSSHQPRNVSRSFPSLAGSVAIFPSYTIPVEPSIERKAPSEYFLPLIEIVFASRNLTSPQPQTQGVFIPRATTAACDVRPPVAVKIPSAATIPAISSGDVSLRTRRTFFPSFAHFSASAAVNTICPQAAPGEALRPVAILIPFASSALLNVGCKSESI